MQNEVRVHLNKIFSSNKNDFVESWRQDIAHLEQHTKSRIEDELKNYGPLQKLVQAEDITEILVNSFDCIYYERNSTLHRHNDSFFSPTSYMALIDRISQNCGSYCSREKPFLEAQLNRMRITLIYSEISRPQTLLSIRLMPKKSYHFKQLIELGLISSQHLQIIEDIIARRKSFIIVGPTSSGKTSLLQACLNSLSESERLVILEDTAELQLPNLASCALLTRQDPSQLIRDVTLEDLLKRALRLRPDRLVVGEIRGPEACALLMALATGHSGSCGSLHAASAQEALLRLEMLVQMGAPQWSLSAIRHLISLSLHYILVLEKKGEQRQLKEIQRIHSVELNGLTTESLI